MKILLVSEYLIFDSIGGTEVYVDALSSYYTGVGHEVYFLKSGDSYNFDHNTRMFTLSKLESESKRIKKFKQILEDMQFDVVHFHTLTSSISVNFLKASKGLNFKTFYTSHTSDLMCIRGDLLHYGIEVCDGIMDQSKCLNCYLNSKNSKNYFGNQFISNLIRNKLGYFKVCRSFNEKLNFLSHLSSYIDKLIVVSNWQKQLLVLNGLSESKVDVVSQGVDLGKAHSELNKINKTNDVIKIGFCGRIDPIKGLHLVIEAFKKLNKKSIQLHIIGVVNYESEYYQKLKQETMLMSNVIWEINLKREDVFRVMSTFDVMCIPSLIFETGPFTLYEAFALNIPIIASNLGGMKDNIITNETGLLFKHDDLEDLTSKISEFINNDELRSKLINSEKPKRDINEIGKEMLEIYANEDTISS